MTGPEVTAAVRRAGVAWWKNHMHVGTIAQRQTWQVVEDEKQGRKILAAALLGDLDDFARILRGGTSAEFWSTVDDTAPGENTKPIYDSHECDSTTLAIHQASLAGWVDGYRFALEHLDEPMVVADRDEFGSGWAGMVGHGAVVIDETKGDGRG